MSDVESLPTYRYWGDEQKEGIIYSVYLKKVRYHRPTRSLSSPNSDSDDERAHLEWETVKVRYVKAATLPRLVESIVTDDGELDSTHLNILLATYRSFATPKQLLQLLLDYYVTGLPAATENGSLLENGELEGGRVEQHRRELRSALNIWLNNYPEDFRQPAHGHPNLHQLLDFCEQHIPDTELHAKIRHRIDKYGREDLTALISGSSSTASIDGALNGSQTAAETYLYYFGGSEAGRLQPSVLSQALAYRPSGGGPGCEWRGYKLPHVDVKEFAEQLTRIDVGLFIKLVPYQCFASYWEKRDNNPQSVSSVTATVNQFNAVLLRVQYSILVDVQMKPSERAQIIACWIDIAQQLRVLKNFSSLKAIISALQSNPVHRLEKTWASVGKEKVGLFQELANIFSEDNNHRMQRLLIMREGTAKFADTVGENDKQMQKVLQKQNNNVSVGTIPYLGTYLTDLIMIDKASNDTVDGDLINFDKRRKEFDVLAQIKLLQGAAKAYNLNVDPKINDWLASTLVLHDKQLDKLSTAIEPSANSAQKVMKKRSTSSGHKKNDSIASNSSSNSSQFYLDVDSVPSSPGNSIDRKLSPSQLSHSSSSSSLLSLDASLNSSHSGGIAGAAAATTNGKSHNSSGNATSQSPASGVYVIKVRYEPDSDSACAATDPTADGVLYKSIYLSNSERTPQVIRNAMAKFGLEGSVEDYTLAQMLPHKELILPPMQNVYYAVKADLDLNFIMRPKTSSKQAISSGKPPKGKTKS